MKHLVTIGSLFTILFLVSCNNSDTIYVDELDSVITHYDESKNFKDYKTFAVPDSIPFLSNKQEVSYLNDENPERATLIINSFRENMITQGYVEVDEYETEPDVLLSIGVLTSNYSGIYGGACGWYGDPYYWGWYPGWGYPGWGWDYYPCWGSGYYNYEFGSLVFDMVDIENSIVENSDNDTLDVSWTGTIRGLLGGSEEGMDERIEKSIHQAFTQSPYLSIK